MKSLTFRRAIVPGIAALAIALTGCGAANDSGDDSGASGDSSDSSSESLSGTLNGGGASSQESAQGVWRAGFQEANSGATVNYDPCLLYTSDAADE